MNIRTEKLKLFVTKIGLLGLFRYLFYILKRYQLRSKYRKYLSNGKLPLPDTVYFDMTFKCNLRCKMCYLDFDTVSKIKELTYEEIVTIFNKMPFIKKVTLIGGEILVRKDIFQILDYFQSKNISLSFCTNGTLVTEEVAKKLISYDNVHTIGISIDGTKELHNFIRGNKDAYDKAINAIKMLGKHKFVTVTSVIVNENIKFLKDIVAGLKDTGVSHMDVEIERRITDKDMEVSAKMLNIERKHIMLSVSHNPIPEYSLKELDEAMENALKESKKVSINLFFQPYLLKDKLKEYFNKELKGEYFCRQLFVSRIDAAGNVNFCFAIRKSFGNLLNDSFEKIWYSDEYNKFRKDFVNKIPPICVNCEKLINL